MYHIAYVVPYVGKLREDINIWSLSAAYNPTISWLVFTDYLLKIYKKVYKI